MKQSPKQNPDKSGQKRAKPDKSGQRTRASAEPELPSFPERDSPASPGPGTAAPHASSASPQPDWTTTPEPDSAAAPDPDAAELNPNQHRALAALLGAPSIAAAARHTGINERTIRRWLHDDPDFRAELSRMRRQYLAHAATRLQSSASAAVQTLLDLLAAKDHIEPGRASLVRTALDFAFRAGSYTDLAERLDDLEVAAAHEKEYGRSRKPNHNDAFDQDPDAEAA
ncbi:MAG: transposase family protein [Bryobacterales bacterium]